MRPGLLAELAPQLSRSTHLAVPDVQLFLQLVATVLGRVVELWRRERSGDESTEPISTADRDQREREPEYRWPVQPEPFAQELARLLHHQSDDGERQRGDRGRGALQIHHALEQREDAASDTKRYAQVRDRGEPGPVHPCPGPPRS